ncbi:MAG TPA: hypothetical protein VMQ44_01620 [Candidatus Saccharimonadales bacterium]|nr:hypothetical protein [Candidatus Saccharimonadales bacterium]
MGEEQSPEIPGAVEFEAPSQEESRFGDKRSLESVMETGSAKIMGRLEDFFDVPHHRNVVELAHITVEATAARNISEYVIVNDAQGNEIKCVYKPVSGEDTKFYRENELNHDYPSEAAAYMVSEHFGFDLVPPTLVRPIEGQLGSLQLFMPQEKYLLESKTVQDTSEESLDRYEDSEDLKTLCVFDWIVANADRNTNNYLLKVDENKQVEHTETGTKIVAIDNGLAFNSKFYRMKGAKKDVPGHYSNLTLDGATDKPVSNPVPEAIMAKVKAGYESRDKLTEVLLSIPDLDHDEITKMWERVEGLIKSGVYLSSYNYRQVLGQG